MNDETFHRASLLVENGDFAGAQILYRNILSSNPDNPRALHALGVVIHRGGGSSEEAIQLLRRAINLKPDFLAARHNLGNIFSELRRFSEAEECYKSALAINPNAAHSLHGFAVSLPSLEDEYIKARNYFNQGEYDQARSIFEKILVSHPDNPRALHGIGMICHRLGDSESAIRNISRASQMNAHYPGALSSLGNIYKETGRLKEALELFRRALDLEPGSNELHSNILMCMQYLSDISPEEIFNEAQNWSDCHGRPSFYGDLNKNNAANKSSKIRLGFVSADFKKHPVGFIIIPFLSACDRDRFELFCYSNSTKKDEITEQIVSLVDVWREIEGKSDQEAWQMVRDDAIDILVDLSGHTAGNRLVLFSMRPAPVQVSWLGYFDTTGLESIDYLITDNFVSLPVEQRWFTEKLVYLPNSRFCYAPPEDSPEVVISPVLANGYVTFGSFNNIAKLSEDVIALWAGILLLVKDSRLVIKWRSCNDNSLISRYQELFRRYGIEPLERIEFRGESGLQEMLKQYGDIDIVLDPFPFSGGVTSLQAIWMGVPIITLKGNRLVGRQTASFLEILDHGELVADSIEQYRDCAVKLAVDVERLATLRGSLRDKMCRSPLCDATVFTKNLSDVFVRLVETAKENTTETLIEVVPAADDFSTALLCLERKDFLEAAERFEFIVANDPNNADAHNNLGIAYFEIGFRDDAKDEFNTATKLSPSNAEAWKNLGKAIRDTKGDPELAARYFRKALSIVPDFDDAWMMLGTTFLDRGRSAEAVKYFKKALELNPANSNTHSILLFAMNYILQITQEDLYRASLKWNEIHATGIAQIQHPIKSDLQHGGRLRIGYVSGDFKRHPVGYHLLPILAEHDRERFEVYCYATLHDRDDLTEKMQGYVAGWRDISKLSDDAAAAMISDDRIDILVDLSGHTGGHRLHVFVRKPAPVQVSWLGYFNTTGVKAIDYLISDETTIPLDEEKWFSEKIIRLPGSRFCYAPPEYAPPVSVPPVLHNGFITFGSFNNIAKLTPEVIELWSRALIDIPESRLIIKWSTLSRKKVRDRLIKQFARHGVGCERLSLRGMSPHVEMLKEYGDIDIVLDPFPFSGGMTSCEALWMGVPVLTLVGDKPAGRQTAGFLRTIGLPEWVAISSDQFITRAKEAASDHEELNSIRFGLRKRMSVSTLCDGVSFTKNLEALFIEIAGKQTVLQQAIIETTHPGQSLVSKNYESDAYTSAAVHYNDGIDQMEAGQSFEAVRLFELAVALNPGFAAAYNNLGILKMQIDNVDEAEQAFGKAIAADVSFAEAHYNLGLVYEKTKRYLEACKCFNAALSLNSEYGEAHLEKGNVFLAQGESFLSLECYENAAMFLSESAITSNNIGTAYLQLDDKQHAELFFCEALLYDPGYAPAYINLSTLYCEIGRVTEAERVVSTGLGHFPADVMLLAVHAKAMILQSRIPEALLDLHRAMEIDPNNAELVSSSLLTYKYMDVLPIEDGLINHKLQAVYHVPQALLSQQFPNIKNPDRMLIIGYVSPDFGRHPVGYFMMPVLEAHNHENYRVICYSDRKAIDPQTLMLESYADVWHETSSYADNELFELVASDGVDILVDLAGHTAGNRLTVFAKKAAPIQVTWLGYPDTTGLSSIDYRITDAIADPEGMSEEHYCERLIRFPDGFLCYQPPIDAPDVVTPPLLLNKYVTFGSFNNLAKVTPEVITLWSRILMAVPNSRLLLKFKSFCDLEFVEKFKASFVALGLTEERIQCVPAMESFVNHLEMYHQIDIALDPFPYNGTTTTFETLFMGVPVVALRGNRHAGRVGASILTHLGLEELLADSVDDYVKIAVSLCSDKKRLSAYHADLRKILSASPFVDAKRFTDTIESAYRTVWQDYCKNC